MFTPALQSRIWLHTQPTDMRKSYMGLLGLIKCHLKENPMQGYFVFINKRKTQMKVFYFDEGGYCIWSKKLVQGQFNYRTSSANKKSLTAVDLQHLLAGIKVEKYRQYKRYNSAF